MLKNRREVFLGNILKKRGVSVGMDGYTIDILIDTAVYIGSKYRAATSGGYRCYRGYFSLLLGVVSRSRDESWGWKCLTAGTAGSPDGVDPVQAP